MKPRNVDRAGRVMRAFALVGVLLGGIVFIVAVVIASRGGH